MIPGFQESILLLATLVIWVFMIAMLIDIVSNKQLSKPTKVVWFVVVLVVFLLGAVAYYALVKRPSSKAKTEAGA